MLQYISAVLTTFSLTPLGQNPDELVVYRSVLPCGMRGFAIWKVSQRQGHCMLLRNSQPCTLSQLLQLR